MGVFKSSSNSSEREGIEALYNLFLAEFVFSPPPLGGLRGLFSLSYHNLCMADNLVIQLVSGLYAI